MKSKNRIIYIVTILLLILLIPAGYQIIYTTQSKQFLSQGNFALLGDPASRDLSSSCFDLDNGEMASTSQADICFGASVGSTVFYVLSPINNASIKVIKIKGDQPSFELCKDDLTTFTKGNIPEIEVNSYICVLTNQRHLALLNIKGTRRASATGIEITVEFKTWKAAIP